MILVYLMFGSFFLWAILLGTSIYFDKNNILSARIRGQIENVMFISGLVGFVTSGAVIFS